MISTLHGTVEYIEDEGLIVVVGGVGYLVHVPVRLLEQVHVGGTVQLFTFQYVREDTLALYGFSDRADLRLFRKMIEVSGVGPRLAMAMLSALEADAIKRAIIHGDIALLTSVSGVGKKTAERLILDLKDSMDMLPDAAQPTTDASQDMSVVDALLSLGYSHAEALAAVKQVDVAGTLEAQVRQALKYLSNA